MVKKDKDQRAAMADKPLTPAEIAAIESRRNNIRGLLAVGAVGTIVGGATAVDQLFYRGEGAIAKDVLEGILSYDYINTYDENGASITLNISKDDRRAIINAYMDKYDNTPGEDRFLAIFKDKPFTRQDRHDSALKSLNEDILAGKVKLSTTIPEKDIAALVKMFSGSFEYEYKQRHTFPTYAPF